jgi:hypothetical protein
MATNQPTAETRQGSVRILLLLPPFILVAAALLLLISAPFSWDAARIIDAPAWMPPVTGILIGLGGLWIGWYSLKHIARATRGAFEVTGLQTLFGLLMFLSGTFMLFSLVTRLPSASTYRSGLDENGEIVVSALGFMAVSLIIGALQLGWIWAGAFLYTNAVTNMQPNRVSARDPNEVDAIGKMLRERQ